MSVTPKLSVFKDGQFLLELSNVLSSQECEKLTENTDKFIFEDISDRYRCGKQRNSSRLLALDDALAKKLWQSINEVLFKEILDNEVSIQPLGFDVTRIKHLESTSILVKQKATLVLTKMPSSVQMEMNVQY